MITIYEAILLLKNLPKEELARSIRRTADAVLNRDGFFRDIKYLGLQQVPYKIPNGGTTIKEAHYLFYEFNVPRKLTSDVIQEWDLDRDTVKYTIHPCEKFRTFDFDKCTFEDEMKPVPYRPEVAKLVHKAKNYARKHSTKRELNIDSHFYPFSR
ncbi:hypothetical protein V9T40_005483 [Parthenolecanium corni]|uniref:Small ribosomal subunit protein bS6m n=1 Tax=Parthenolecanium corni TaxID=536013 RepID=A0AAN9TGY0_9HEMI